MRILSKKMEMRTSPKFICMSCSVDLSALSLWIKFTVHENYPNLKFFFFQTKIFNAYLEFHVLFSQ